MCFINVMTEITVWLELDNFYRAYILCMPFLWENFMSYFKVENLCYAYIKKPLCLKDVNFSANKNDKILVLGLKDSGKTTLLKTLSGFDDKFFGKVLYNGKEIRQIPDEDKNVSLIFENPVLLNSSIDKNLDFLYESLHREIASTEEKESLLKRFNLNYDVKTKVKKLSTFEKFKLCFLRTFIKNPDMVFIDDIFDNDFTKQEKTELIQTINLISKNKLMFLCASEKSLKNEEITSQKWNKVLYLNNAKLYEFKSINEFNENLVDLDACSFCEEIETKEGYCVRQDGCFYLCFDEKYIIKIDKKFETDFEKLKLAENENEDIVIAYNKEIEIDLSNNEEFTKLLLQGNIKIYSKLDRNKVL